MAERIRKGYPAGRARPRPAAAAGKRVPATVPAPLRPGDTVAIVAPAGPVDPGRLERGLSRLRAAGFVTETAEGLFRREKYLAGDDAHRAGQLSWGLSHPRARAVMAARGGFGVARILPLVDWKGGMKRPRLLVGYSDFSGLLAYVSTRLGIPTVHGPMAAADLGGVPDPHAFDAFVRLAGGKTSPREPWGAICERLGAGKTVTGILSGGCLSVLTALIGTPWEPDFSGTLLFLEDVQEACYRLDRMLTQWIQSGRLSRIVGIVAGRIEPMAGESEEDLRRTFAEAGRRLRVPVWYGFPAGHGNRNVPIPFGVRARMDARGRLFLLEPPVREG